MKKIFLSLCCVFVGAFLVVPVMAMSETQKNSVVAHCGTIKEELKELQKADVRARVYLGEHYDTILADYIVPFNVRMVENNLSTPSLVENQNKITSTKALFSSDFITYQQGLEELIVIDCKNEPEEFYKKLDVVRQRRKVVEQDTLKMRNMISEQLKIATQMKGKL